MVNFPIMMVYSGTDHLNQTDVVFVVPRVFQFGFKSTLDNDTAHRVNMDICLAFLKRHLLKGQQLLMVKL